MAYAISVDDHNGIVLVVTGGDLAASEFASMIRETDACCRDRRLTEVLVDHSMATVKNISAAEVQAIAELCSQMNDSLAGGRLAVVLVRDIDWGLSRMWLSYAEPLLRYESRLFRERRAAFNWLLERRSPAEEGRAG